MSNPFNHKVEIKLLELEDYNMAQMCARRAHEFLKKDIKFGPMKLSIMISSGADQTEMFLCSTKLTQLEPADVYVVTMLIRTYVSILMPFFPELEKKMARKSKRNRK